VNLALILAVSVWFRVRDIDRLPGVSGDETFIASQVGRFLQTRDIHSDKVLKKGVSGRYLDVVTVAYFLPAMALFRPSFWLVRSYPVVVGLLTVALAYVMTARAWGRTTGLAAALAFATAPACIAYSRMSWEPSLIPLFGVIVLPLAARGRWGWVLAALPLGYSMHPTNLCLLPLLVFLLLLSRMPRDGSFALSRRTLGILSTLGLGVTALLGAIVLWKFPYPRVAEAWISPAAWGWYAVWFGRLISGVTVYRYWVGSPHAGLAAVHDVAFWAIAVALVVTGVPCLVRARQWDRLGVVGWAFIQPWALFFAAGPYVLEPSHNRFGLVFLAPTLLALAILVRARLDEFASARRNGLRFSLSASLVALLWLWLLGFELNYFVPLQATGGESYVAYRTGPIEPKTALFRLIQRDMASGQRSESRVVFDDYFLFWTVQFLALDRPEIACEFVSPALALRPDVQDHVARLVAQGGYVAAWRGSPIVEHLIHRFPREQLRLWQFRDTAGRPIVSLLRARQAADAPLAAASHPLRQ
jgi:hypothetical protein